MCKYKRLSNPLTLCLISACLVASPTAFAISKWVDEKGQVHYGDRVPTKYLNQERSTLNEQGVTIGTTKRSKTQDELDKEEQEKRLKAEAQKKEMIKRRKQALHDRELLDTYTTESDLVLARDARIEAVDSQLVLAKTLIKNAEQKLAVVNKRIERIEKSGRKAPDNLYKEVKRANKDLATNNEYIKVNTEKRQQIIATFDSDIKRFRELKEEKRLLKEKRKAQKANR